MVPIGAYLLTRIPRPGKDLPYIYQWEVIGSFGESLRNGYIRYTDKKSCR